MTEDEQYLHWLSIAHYALGVLSLLFFLVFGGVFVVGSLVLFRPEMFSQGTRSIPPPEAFGVLWVGMAAVSLLSWLAIDVCTFLAARWLTARKNYVFCLVVAALNCMYVPFGTLVGVFTIMVLSRPTVKAIFKRSLPEEV